MKLLTTTLTILILTSCYNISKNEDRVEQSRLIGKYVFQTWNQDTIDVNSDGTYLHYNTSNGRHLENSGTWIYDSIQGRVVFANFSFLTDGLPSGYWDTKVRSKDNEVHFIYATDVYKGYYLRIDSIDRR